MTVRHDAAPSGAEQLAGASSAATTRTVEFAPSAAEKDPVSFARRRARQEFVLSWSVPIIFFGLWQSSAELGWIDTRFFPAPSTIAAAAYDLAKSGDLHRDIIVSMKRVLLGFGLGVAAGVAAGVALGLSRLARAAFEPLLNAFYTVPKLALLPLLLLIFGIGDTPKILLIAITVFFFMWIGTMEAFTTVPRGYREAVRSFGAGPIGEFKQVLLPAVLPQVFVSMRVSAGVAVLVMVGAEFVQGNDGIGNLIWRSWSLFIADRMYVGIVTVALLGLLFTMAIKAIGQLVMPWTRDEQGRS